MVRARRAGAATARTSGPRGQVERPPRLLVGQPPRPRPGGPARAGRSGRPAASGSVRGRGDRPGPGRPSTAAKRRPQRLVAADHLVEGPAAARRRRAGPTTRTAAVTLNVGRPGASWSRNQSACWANESGGGPARGDRPRSAASRPRRPSPPGGLDPRGQAGDGRGLEQGPERELDAEGVAEPRDDLGGQQRVAAEVEEVVVGPDPVDPQDRRPRPPRPPPRPGSAGRTYAAAGAGRTGLGRGQGLAVDLAVGRQRQGVAGPRSRRDHVARAAFAPSEPPEVAARRGEAAASGDDVGDQAAARPGGPRGRRRTASRTPGCRRGRPRSRPARSGSPRILTWSSTRPRYSSSPSGRQRARSPVR